MDFVQHVGKDQRTRAQIKAGVKKQAGFGAEWIGILFRRTYPELADVIRKSKKLFSKLYGSAAKYHEGEHRWTFPTGETLHFKFISRPEEYDKYHGHEYPWMAFEELTTWPDDKCYVVMISLNRSTCPGIPLKIRSTTNPYGIGHGWVKKRFKLPNNTGKVINVIIKGNVLTDGSKMPDRVSIRGHVMENRVLLHAQPNYLGNIAAAARNPSEKEAWLNGSWDIISGGMFNDVWDARFHIIPNIPFSEIPLQWRIDRAYDHGQSSPFSVGWWAESNGEPITLNGREYGHIKGDLFRIAEWYGCRDDEQNVGLYMMVADIAAGIKSREEKWGIRGRVRIGPADASIFSNNDEPTETIAGKFAIAGIVWTESAKDRGSRKQGWQMIRERLEAAKASFREKPGIFVCQRCEHSQRIIPSLPRDHEDLDDVNTKSEDHIGDEWRYRVRLKKLQAGRRSF